jgi:hypothetical protein
MRRAQRPSSCSPTFAPDFLASAAGGDLSGYYNLLAQVARQTATTEMPQGMPQVISACPELSNELREWYRAV